MIIVKKDTERFIGKRLRDLLNSDEQILQADQFKDLDRLKDSVFKKGCLSYIQTYDDMSMLVDMHNDLVLCFRDGQLLAVFYCYDLSYADIHANRGRILAIGHETVHEYFWDTGEYRKDYTR